MLNIKILIDLLYVFVNIFIKEFIFLNCLVQVYVKSEKCKKL